MALAELIEQEKQKYILGGLCCQQNSDCLWPGYNIVGSSKPSKLTCMRAVLSFAFYFCFFRSKAVL